jgi:hypothetical protein
MSLPYAVHDDHILLAHNDNQSKDSMSTNSQAGFNSFSGGASCHAKRSTSSTNNTSMPYANHVSS